MMDGPASLRRHWAERSPRERRLLSLGAVFLVGVAAYLTLIEPAYSGIVRLQRLLPQTRAQAGELEALISEAQRLRAATPVVKTSGADARAALLASLAAAGMAPARTTALPNGELRLALRDVPFKKWAAWLATAEGTQGVRAVAVTANAVATAGNVDVDFSLRFPSS